MTSPGLRKAEPSLAAAVRAGLAVSSLPKLIFSANGVCSSQPGATPQEDRFESNSAESAIHRARRTVNAGLIPRSTETRFQRWPDSVDLFPGATPQAQINVAPLALPPNLAEKH
jgi:hypothetical protein